MGVDGKGGGKEWRWTEGKEGKGDEEVRRGRERGRRGKKREGNRR